MMQQYVAIPNAVLLHMALIALVVVLVYENFTDGSRVKVGLIDLLLARLSNPRDSLQSRDDEEDGQRSAVGEGAIEYDKHASRNSSIRPRLQKSVHVRHASTPETVFSILNVRTPHNDTHYSSNVVKFTSNTRRCNTTINKSYYIVTTKSGNDKYGAALQRNNISSSSSSFSLSPCGKEGGRSSNSFDSVESTPITPSTTQTVRVNPGSSAHAPALVSQFLPGCEPGSPAAVEMSLLFPDVAEVDICRFLAARKGSVDQAADMLRKRQRWYETFFPLKFNAQFEAAIASGCFFPFGETKDKTPVLYFRGALYDNSKCSAEMYVLLAAHIIEHTLKEHDALNMTVFVHTINVHGAPNNTADIEFIKSFVAVLADNFPERLKRLVLYPFPWYGRAIWSVVKMFVDKRSQDKLLFLSKVPDRKDGTPNMPQEVLEFLDVDDIPCCCGGTNKGAVMDIRKTFCS